MTALVLTVAARRFHLTTRFSHGRRRPTLSSQEVPIVAYICTVLLGCQQGACVGWPVGWPLVRVDETWMGHIWISTMLRVNKGKRMVQVLMMAVISDKVALPPATGSQVVGKPQLFHFGMKESCPFRHPVRRG
jgi:hypothetical protein